MRTRSFDLRLTRLLLPIIVLTSGTLLASTSPLSAQSLIINEVVTDPQQDWNDSEGGSGIPFDQVPGTGTITSSDEWIEIRNVGPVPVDLSGYTLDIIDTTPATVEFSNPSAATLVFSDGGSVSNFLPGEYLVVGNPLGSMNNSVYLVLRDPQGAAVSDVELGDDFEGDGAGDGAPDGSSGGGNATGLEDESVARVPDSIDTGDDVADFVQQTTSIGVSNDTVAVVDPVVEGSHDWSLHVDSDTSGGPTPGDTIRHTIQFENVGTVDCSIDVSVAIPSQAISWSVISAGGGVDTSTPSILGVNDLALSVGNVAEVIYDLVLAPETQGQDFSCVAQFTVSPGGEMDQVSAPMVMIEGATDVPLLGQSEMARLIGNHPNPFNPSTMIVYSIPLAGHVELDVYDVSGRHVITLVNGLVPGQTHQIRWNGKDGEGMSVASGVYLYQLRVGDVVETRRMVLVK